MNLAGKDYAVAIGALLKHQPATGLASQPSATRHETL